MSELKDEACPGTGVPKRFCTCSLHVAKHDAPKQNPCRRCGKEMKAGQAIYPAMVGWLSDFGDGDPRGQTLNPGPATGNIEPAWKCSGCGHSVTP